MHIVALKEGAYHLPERDLGRDVDTGKWGEGEDHVEGGSGGTGGGGRDEAKEGKRGAGDQMTSVGHEIPSTGHAQPDHVAVP